MAEKSVSGSRMKGYGSQKKHGGHFSRKKQPKRPASPSSEEVKSVFIYYFYLLFVCSFLSPPFRDLAFPLLV